MPRPTFPHTLADITHAVDGPFGLVVGDLPDGRIVVLQRGRKTPGYTLRTWDGPARRTLLAEESFAGRAAAVDAMAAAIGLDERLGG
jgi:hypothetical protein